MELVKRPIRTYRTVEIRENEEMFENSIIVPDSKPDVKAILVADAECFVNKVEKSGRMIEVGGEIRYRILYVADSTDNRIESIVTRFPWSVSCQKPKVEGEWGVHARCRSQHTEANALNGRKIVSRTVMSLLCKFYEIKGEELGMEVSGENVFIKQSPVNVVMLKDTSDTVVRVNNTLALPHGSSSIKEILFARVNLGKTEVSYREEEPALETKGLLNLLYRGETAEDNLESVVLEFPVRANMGIRAGNDALIYHSLSVRSWDIEPCEDSDGLYTQTCLSMELEINTQAMRFEEQNMVEDAYCLNAPLIVNKSPVQLITDERELNEDFEVNTRIRMDNAEGRLDEVIMVSANERNIASMVNDRSANVQGHIGVNMLYATNMGIKDIKNQNVEMPFTHSFQLPSEGTWNVVDSSFAIEDVSFDIIGSDSVEVLVKIRIKLKVDKVENVSAVESLVIGKDDDPVKTAPIIMYFAQPGDSLWNVAKKYRIPLSRLAQDNNLETEAPLQVGRRIMIMS